MWSSASFVLLALPLGLAAPTPAPAAGAGNLGGTTQNGLAAGSACKGMTVIFARGTTEQGNVGSLAGPPFFQALNTAVGGDMVVQGVDYPADIPGELIPLRGC